MKAGSIRSAFLFSCFFALAYAAGEIDLDDALCDGHRVAFTVSDNTDVSASPSHEIKNVTEEQCIQICNDNRDSEGRFMLCASFTYDHVIFSCAIYKQKSHPDGNLERIAAPAKRYFDKFCLEDTINKECASNQFLRVDDSILKGYAKNTSIVSTLADCVNQCLTEPFECKSAMYFHEEGECITNIESAQTKPEEFGAPDDDDKVIYFTNGCQRDTTVPEKKMSRMERINTKEEKAIKQEEPELSVDEVVTTTVSPIEEEATLESEQASTVGDFRDITILESVTDAVSHIEESSTPLPQLNIQKIAYATSGPFFVAEDTTEEAPQDAPQDEPIASTAAVDLQEQKEVTKAPEATPSVDEPSKTSKSNLLKSKIAKGSGSTKSLQIQKIDDDQFFSEWADWTECTQPGERKIRRRKCLDLRKCRGALMQVDWCPKDLRERLPQAEEEVLPAGPVGPVRNPIPVEKTTAESGLPPAILPNRLPNKRLEPLPEGAPGTADDIWSPWLGICQQFASSQPCKNHEIIGFESRECIAKDPKACKGPFFRYCTLPC